MSRQRIDPVLRDAVRAELERLPDRVSSRRTHGVVQRRWVPLLTSVVVAALVVAVGLLALQGRPVPPATAPTSTPTSQPSNSTSFGVADPVGSVIRAGVPLPATGANVAAADDSALYVALNPKGDGLKWVIERIDAQTGAIVRRSLTLDYLSRLAVGPAGVYISTSVIERFQRFQRIPDTILRLDPKTLRTLTTRHFPPSDASDGAISLAASGSRLVATTGDGHVLALDPTTLTTRTTIDLLDKQDILAGDGLSAPTFSDGRVWVLGADHGQRLVSLDPDTLSEVSRTAAFSEEQRGYIVPRDGGVFLAGSELLRIDADGSVTNLAALRPAVIRAWTTGGDVLVSDGTTIDKYSQSGALVGSLALRTDRAQVVAAGPHITWVVGLAGVASGLSAIDSRR